MKNGSIVIIVSVIAVLGLLSIYSVHASNVKIAEDEKTRKERNAFSDILDSIRAPHPVFNESLKGKIIVINVCASWNHFSEIEIPQWNKLAKEFASDKVVFLALDPVDSSSERANFNRDHVQFDYPVLYRQQALVWALTTFEFPSEKNELPLNVVINPDGKFEFFYAGYHASKREAIREYLAEAAKK